MGQKTHVMHGRDHCPHGADPIPCLPPASPVAGSYEETVASVDGLLGYWRLGETGEPWADTSGTTPAAPLTLDESGTAPTPDVTGALTTDDDGAVRFNYDGTTIGGGKLLRTTVGSRFADLIDLTVAGWINVKASAVTRTSLIVGSIAELVPAGTIEGWALEALYPSRQIRFGRVSGPLNSYVSTAAGVVADQWYFVVGTYDGTDVRLYMNAVLVGETPDAIGGFAANPPLRIGGLGAAVSTMGGAWFYGTVDEVAVWERALTLGEIQTLYASGIDELVAAGGSVLISDGTGGATWGQVTTPAIADQAVTTPKITDEAVTTAKIAGEAVTPAKVEPGTDGQVLTTVAGAVTWATPTGGGGDPADDTAVWMPLTTVTGGVPELVWDADDSLIPTLTPL